MNDRIRELAKEALNYAEKNQSAEVQQHWFKLYNEKFAELIVEECANVADENYIHRGSRTCGLAIRLHFGVNN